MKVLFVVSIPFPEGGANTRRIRTLVTELDNQGVEVSFLIPFSRQPAPNPQVVDGIKVNWCYVPKSEGSLLSTSGRVRLSVQIISRLSLLFRLLKLSLYDDYDWLYLYQPMMDGLFAALIARVTGHHIWSEYVDQISPPEDAGLGLRIFYSTWNIADFFVPKLSSVICVISSILERRYRRIAANKKIIRVPTLVNFRTFQKGSPLHWRNELKMQDAKLIVYTGSLTFHQGVRNLIAAMALIAEKHEDARLVIAGSSLASDKDDAPALIRQFGLSEKAHYLGRITFEEVVDLQSAAEVLVAPKLDHPVNHAGFSTKLAEYLAVGKPVVVSDVGDVSIYLKHETHAMICKPGDVEDLALNISHLLSDPQLAAQIAVCGQQVAWESFGIKGNVERIITELKEF